MGNNVPYLAILQTGGWWGLTGLPCDLPPSVAYAPSMAKRAAHLAAKHVSVREEPGPAGAHGLQRPKKIVRQRTDVKSISADRACQAERSERPPTQQCHLGTCLDDAIIHRKAGMCTDHGSRYNAFLQHP